MKKLIRITVAGIPAPQGSKKAFNNPKTGVPIIVDDNKESLRTWRQDVMYAVRDYLVAHPMPRLDEPCQVDVMFRFPLPSSDGYRTMHATKPDPDKLLRSTFDAIIAAGLIVDDARITAGSWVKLYAQPPMTPGATITVEPLGHIEASMREALKAGAKAARKA